MSTLSRTAVEREARDAAIRTIEAGRPDSWTPEGKAFWGQTCGRCGRERPGGSVYGFACNCEREAAEPLIAQHVASRREEVARAILDRSGIARRYAGCGFDGFMARPGTEQALVAVRGWAEDFALDTERGLLLAGPFGSGKTHLAVAALRRAIDRTLVEGRYVSAGDLVGQVRGGSNITWKPVDEAIRAELLVLDDLGQEGGTEFTRDIVARVIFGRYEAALPTIVTSNHGPSGLTDAFGGAIVSRLHEMAESVVLKATDYRATKVGR